VQRHRAKRFDKGRLADAQRKRASEKGSPPPGTGGRASLKTQKTKSLAVSKILTFSNRRATPKPEICHSSASLKGGKEGGLVGRPKEGTDKRGETKFLSGAATDAEAQKVAD